MKTNKTRTRNGLCRTIRFSFFREGVIRSSFRNEGKKSTINRRKRVLKINVEQTNFTFSNAVLRNEYRSV